MGAGGVNVHTIKLNRPVIAPMSVPALVPSSMEVIITGIIASVATIGPIAGSEPNGVKQNTASIAAKSAN